MSIVREVFRLPFKVMKISGFWQNESSSWLYRFYGFFMHGIFISFFMLFQVFYFFHVESTQELLDCIGTWLTVFGEFFKSLYWMSQMKKILELVNDLENLVKLSEYAENKSRNQLKGYLKQGSFAHRMIMVSGVSTCLLAGLVPLFNRQDHKLAYVMHFPYLDYKHNDSLFILLALYQMSPVFICLCILTVDCLPILFLCFAIGMIEELSTRLENIGVKQNVRAITKNPQLVQKRQNENETAHNELLQCVKIHLKIRDFVSKIQKNFSAVICVQGVISSIVFCSIAFMLSLVSLIF